jgi:uncharacterized protein involved in response to NO
MLTNELEFLAYGLAIAGFLGTAILQWIKRYFKSTTD